MNETVRMDGLQVRADQIHRYKLPIHDLFVALTIERGRWLRLAAGEVQPDVVEAIEDQRVIWSTFWLAAPNDLVVLDLSHGAVQQSRLRMRWLTDSPPDDRGVGITRQRLNRKLGADIRGVVSEFYWRGASHQP